MKKIKMIETNPGYQDGVTKEIFYAGNIYTIKDDLADAFLSLGWAENVLEISSVDPAEFETPEKPKKKKAKGKK